MKNETKTTIYLCLFGGFLLGLLLVSMSIMACQTDQWYKQVMAQEKTRVIFQDENVSIWELKADSVHQHWDEP